MCVLYDTDGTLKGPRYQFKVSKVEGILIHINMLDIILNLQVSI